MNFIAFAADHGLIIERLVVGKWVRCPTVDHPRKMNGSYIYNGEDGAVKNWALHEKAVYWRDKEGSYDREVVLRQIKKNDAEKKLRQEKAAKKAGWIMHMAKCDYHPYLAAKGFPAEKGWVWEGKLVVPMRKDGHLVGCQLIDQDGGKKFLYGQITKGATAQINAKGRNIYAEGYATAMSVRAALRCLKMRYNIIVCLSAGNLEYMAKQDGTAFVVADHDLSGTGQRVAKKTGAPFWMPPLVGMDANDYMKQVGVEVLAKEISLAL